MLDTIVDTTKKSLQVSDVEQHKSQFASRGSGWSKLTQNLTTSNRSIYCRKQSIPKTLHITTDNTNLTTAALSEMLGISPAKRFEATRVDARRSMDLGLKAHVPMGGRMSPGNTAEWTAPRFSFEATVMVPERSTTPSVTTSVISHCPSGSAMTDSAVEAMVETIDGQEKEIQRLYKEIMGLMRDVAEATRKEENLRDFIERSSAATESLWTKNYAMQESNAVLRNKLAALGGSKLNAAT
ncbi:hypothetical protein BSKO_02368 [Bryopsis sp. KO-2023]|nr:hypothetical protein BSKO_02368 [Bryopsis sp. KO-2023]